MYYRLTPRLGLLYNEAYQEAYGKQVESIDHTFAIYPKRFYNNDSTIDCNKTIDFLFIGAFKFQDHLQEYGYNNRKWIIDFAKSNFTNESLFINTTKNESLKQPWVQLGEYDHTLDSNTAHVVPVKLATHDLHKFDTTYFTKMASS